MNLIFIKAIVLMAVIVEKCNESVETIISTQHTEFKMARDMGAIQNREIDEASGIIVSRNNPGLLWVHNDSGDEPRLFLIDSTGAHKGIFHINSTTNRDWEDIAIGPGPEEGINYIYIGDIGDNSMSHGIYHIYRFPEPDLHISFPVELYIDQVETISFFYPDEKKDAESLMIDPHTKDLYIVSKNEAAVNVYLVPYPQSTTEVITLHHLGVIDIQQAVAGDISAEGKEVLIKTYSDIYYWNKQGEESIPETLKKVPKRISYQSEPQGEAVAWKVDGSGYFTLTEKVGEEIPHLYFYERIAKK